MSSPIQPSTKPAENVPRHALTIALLRAIARYPDEPLTSISAKLSAGSAERILRDLADALERGTLTVSPKGP